MLVRSLLIGAVLVWGWTFVATKVALEYLSAVELLGLRLLIGLPVMFGLILLRRGRPAFTRREQVSLAAGSAVLTAHFLIQITGIRYTSATNTGWLIAVTPLVLVLLSRVFLGERVGRAGLLGVAIASAGILLLVSRGELSRLGWLSRTGDWLVLASSVTWAVYTLLMRDLSRREDPLVVTFVALLPALCVALALMAFTSHWDKLAHLPLRVGVALLFLGLLGTTFAHWFWQAGVAWIGAARAGLYLYLEPLATTILAVPYLGEPFGAATGAGGLLVLGGVYLAERRRRGTA